MAISDPQVDEIEKLFYHARNEIQKEILAGYTKQVISIVFGKGMDDATRFLTVTIRVHVGPDDIAEGLDVEKTKAKAYKAATILSDVSVNNAKSILVSAPISVETDQDYETKHLIVEAHFRHAMSGVAIGAGPARVSQRLATVPTVPKN